MQRGKCLEGRKAGQFVTVCVYVCVLYNFLSRKLCAASSERNLATATSNSFSSSSTSSFRFSCLLRGGVCVCVCVWGGGGVCVCSSRELAENCISMQMPSEPQTVNDFVTTL